VIGGGQGLGGPPRGGGVYAPVWLGQWSNNHLEVLQVAVVDAQHAALVQYIQLQDPLQLGDGVHLHQALQAQLVGHLPVRNDVKRWVSGWNLLADWEAA